MGHCVPRKRTTVASLPLWSASAQALPATSGRLKGAMVLTSCAGGLLVQARGLSSNRPADTAQRRCMASPCKGAGIGATGLGGVRVEIVPATGLQCFGKKQDNAKQSNGSAGGIPSTLPFPVQSTSTQLHPQTIQA